MEQIVIIAAGIMLLLSLLPVQVPVTADEKAVWLSVAKSFDGVPYKKGGSDLSGIDCSGLVIELYHAIGVFLFKYEDIYLFDVSADVLYKYNTVKIDFNNLQPGDLIFYDLEDDGIIDHVAVFVRCDSNGVWVWDAMDEVDGLIINKVSYRLAKELFTRHPKFGKPLKVEIPLLTPLKSVIKIFSWQGN